MTIFEWQSSDSRGRCRGGHRGGDPPPSPFPQAAPPPAKKGSVCTLGRVSRCFTFRFNLA